MLRRNPVTGNVEEYSAEQQSLDNVKSAVPSDVLQSKDKDIPMLDPNGAPVYVARESLTDAVNQGYKYESNIESQQRQLRDHYDSPLMAGVLGAARGLSFGLSDAALYGIDKALDTDFAGRAAAYEEHNPTASTVGDVGATIGSAVFGPLAAVGKLGSKALLRTVGKEIAEETLAKKIVRSGLSLAGEGVAQGVLQGAGQTISDASLGKLKDKKAVAESLVRNVGINALLSGAANAAVGGLVAGAGKTWSWGRKTFSLDDSNLKKILQTSDDLPEADYRELLNEIAPDDKAVLETMEGMRAADELGVELPAGVKSGSEFIKKLEQSIAKDPTPFGQQVAKGINKTYQQIDSVVEDIFSSRSKLTQAELGSNLKKQIVGKLEDSYKQISKEYSELQGLMTSTPVYKEVRLPLATKIEKTVNNSIVQGTPVARTSNNVAKLLRKPSMNLDELKQVQTDLKDVLQGAPLSKAERKLVISTLGTLEEAYETSFELSAKELVNRGIATKAQIEDFLSKRYLANQAYKEFMTGLQDFTSRAGISKKRMYFSDFMELMDEIPDEKMIQKLWRPNDKAFMQKFARDYPQLFEELRAFEMAKVYKKLQNADGNVGLARFIKEVQKSDPFYGKTVFGEKNLEKVKNLQSVYKTLPDQLNPSGTAEAIGLADGLPASMRMIFSPRKTAADATRYFIYKQGAKVGEKVAKSELETAKNIFVALKKKTEKQLSALNKVEAVGDAVSKARAPLIQGAAGITLEMMNDDFKSFEEEINELQGVVEGASIDKNVFRSVAGLDPEVAQELQTQSVNAAQYLLASAPKPVQPKRLLDKASAYSPREVREWLSVATIVDDPKKIIPLISNGSVTQKQVDALRTIYPNFFENILSAMATVPPDEMSEEAKAAVNVFTDFEAKSISSAESIRVFQSMYAAENAKEQAQQLNTKNIDNGETATQRVTAK